ncbi:hypothetical protein D3C76_1330490 [compost metagenome]
MATGPDGKSTVLESKTMLLQQQQRHYDRLHHEKRLADLASGQFNHFRRHERLVLETGSRECLRLSTECLPTAWTFGMPSTWQISMPSRLQPAPRQPVVNCPMHLVPPSPGCIGLGSDELQANSGVATSTRITGRLPSLHEPSPMHPASSGEPHETRRSYRPAGDQCSGLRNQRADQRD